MYKASELELNKLLSVVLERDASDLHLVVGEPPIIRVDTQLMRLDNYEVLSNDVVSGLVDVLMTPVQKKMFEEQMSMDLSYAFKDQIRFRVNVYRQRGVLAIALRVVPNHVKTLAELNLPAMLKKFTERKQGLVLMVGPTGHGKSTALAAMIDEINNTRAEHILTIEDPIEFIFTPKQSIVTQRELYTDTATFSGALKAALREDINVVLVGERV